MITGKRVQHEAGQYADEAGEARRQALLALMNEGEDEAALGSGGRAGGGPGGASSRVAEQQALAARARADPKLMLHLMQQSHEAQQAKKQRLGRMAGGGGGEGFDDRAMAATAQPERPHNYKRERDAREAADYMKADSGF